jgi:hypothetical protein
MSENNCSHRAQSCVLAGGSIFVLSNAKLILPGWISGCVFGGQGSVALATVTAAEDDATEAMLAIPATLTTDTVAIVAVVTVVATAAVAAAVAAAPVIAAVMAEDVAATLDAALFAAPTAKFCITCVSAPDIVPATLPCVPTYANPICDCDCDAEAWNVADAVVPAFCPAVATRFPPP